MADNDRFQRALAAHNIGMQIVDTVNHIRAVTRNTATPSTITLIHLYGHLLHLLLKQPRGFVISNNMGGDFPTAINKLYEQATKIDQAYMASLTNKKLRNALGALHIASNCLLGCAHGINIHELDLKGLATSRHFDNLTFPYKSLMIDITLLVETEQQMIAHRSKVSMEDAMEGMAELFEET